MHRRKIPTGDPNIPPEVRLAKRVKHLIGDKAEVCDGTEDFSMYNDDADDLVEEDEVNQVPPPPPAAAVPVIAQDTVTRPVPVIPVT